eukprot:scaffold5477_cov124-Isochrysis_galbana.AAC.6
MCKVGRREPKKLKPHQNTQPTSPPPHQTPNGGCGGTAGWWSVVGAFARPLTLRGRAAPSSTFDCPLLSFYP